MNRLVSMTALLSLLMATAVAASEVDGEDPFEFKSRLSAAQSTAEPASNGKGEARVRFNRRLKFVRVKVEVKNLVGELRSDSPGKAPRAAIFAKPGRAIWGIPA